MTRARILSHAVLGALIGSLTAAPARGQARDSAAADALFQDGKALMDGGRYDLACPKLAESYRLDPATGSLLALAVCHERAGKLASAWRAFRAVEDRARADRDAERQEAAHQRVVALAPRLATVTLRLGPAVRALPGLEVRRDGELVDAKELGTGMPVDPGAHVIDVRATGKRPARRDWTAVEARPADVTVDALEDAPSGAAPEDAASGAAPSRGLSGTQVAGLVIGGAGVASLGVGAIFGAVALGEASELEALGYDADASTCSTGALAACTEAYDSASSSGTLSTVFLVAGGVLVAGGLTLVLVGGDAGGEADAAQVTVGPTLAGVRARGTF